MIKKAFLLCTVVSVIAIILINVHIIVTAESYIIIPDQEGYSAIVPGARVYDSGVISDIYRDRLLTAAELYRDKKVQAVFVSADNRRSHNYETDAAVEFLKLQNVRSDDIFADPSGYTTYDTMIHAEKFGISKGIVATQKYHLYRSIYIARNIGIDCYGAASDRQKYKAMIFFKTREYLAGIKAFFMIHLHDNSSNASQKKR